MNMSEPQVIEVTLGDEIPKFHSGRRRIIVLQVGRKWVKLQHGNKKVRITKEKWAEILLKKSNRNFGG